MKKRHWLVTLFAILPLLSDTAEARKPGTFVEGELLVKFAVGEAEIGKGKAHAAVRAKMKRKFKFIGWQQVDLPPGLSVEKAIELYKKQPGVLDAVANEIGGFAASENNPNDPVLSGAGDLLWSLKKIGAPAAWVGSTGNPDLVVAVVDSGIDYNHPDLAANIWQNPGEIAGNGIDDDGNGLIDDVVGYDFGDNDADPMDRNGHGTHVAGIIGAVGNNGMGVTGVNWNVKLMPVKVTQNSNRLTAANVIQGLEYIADMIDRGVYVRVANHSYIFNSLADSGPLREAMAALTSNDRYVLNVCGAGNGGADSISDDNDTVPVYPANFTINTLISVAATDSNDQMATNSNFGKTRVHLTAPGVLIFSTWPTALAGGAMYRMNSGTSMAAPHVSGAAALILAMRPVLTPLQVKNALLDTADRIPGLQDRVATGARLNVRRAMWSYDMGNPSLIMAAESSGYRNQLIELHGAASETKSEIAEVRIRIERDGFFWTGANWISTPATDPRVQLITTLTYNGGTGWGWSYTQLPKGAKLLNGSYKITVIAEDLPGYQATKSTTFTLDQVFPTVTLTAPLAGNYTSPLEGAWIVGTAGDDGPLPKLVAKILRQSDGFYWDGAQWTNALVELPCRYTTGNQWAVFSRLPEDLEVANGQYGISITATDKAGNTKQANANITVDVTRIYGDTTGNATEFDIAQTGRPPLNLSTGNPAPSLTYTFSDASSIFSSNFCLPAPGGGYFSGIHSTTSSGGYPGCVIIRHGANGVELWRLERQRRILTVTNGSSQAEERWSDADQWYTLGDDTLQHDFGLSRLDKLVLDSVGNLYAGVTYGRGYYGEGPFCVILKFNPNGKLLWRKSVTGSGFAKIMGMELFADNSVAVLLASTNSERPTLARVGSTSDFSKVLTTTGTVSRALFMATSADDKIHVVCDEASGTPRAAEDSNGYSHVLRKYDSAGLLERKVTVAPSKAPERWTAIKMVDASGDLYAAGLMMLPGDSDGRVAVSRFNLNRAKGTEQVWRCYAPYRSASTADLGEVILDCNASGVALASTGRYPAVGNHTGCLTKFSSSGVMRWSRNELFGDDTGFNEVLRAQSLAMDDAGNVYLASYHPVNDALTKVAANGDVQYVRILGDGARNIRVSPVPMLLLPSVANPTTLGVMMKNVNQPSSNQSGLYLFSNPAVETVKPSFTQPAKYEIWVNQGDTLQIGPVLAEGTKPITYQWKRSVSGVWQNVTGAKSNQLNIANATTAAHGGYYYLQANNIAGTANTNTYTVWVTSPVSLATALDTTTFNWTTNGAIPWAGQTGGQTRDLVDSAMVVATTAGQVGSLRSQVTGPGTLNFKWFQTNEYYANLELFVDGVRVKKHDYLQHNIQQVPISAGAHTLEWRFTSINTSDPGYYPIRGFVDQVSFE